VSLQHSPDPWTKIEGFGAVKEDDKKGERGERIEGGPGGEEKGNR